MKLTLIVFSLIALAFLGIDTSYGALSDPAVAKIEWKEASYPHHEGTKATVIVTDPDMNEYQNARDYLWVSIHSDSAPSGFRMPLFETDLDTGRFEGMVEFAETSPSGRGFLHVSFGDTITAKYLDTSFPANYTSLDSRKTIMTENGIEMTATSVVFVSSPPLERVPASDLRLLSLDKELIKDNLISVDQQVRLVSDLKNQQNRTQPFAYIVQIKNEQDMTESLSWLTGNLTAHQKISSGVTWIPFKEGAYSATVFVWESIHNPTALSPPVELEFNVRAN